MDNADQRTSSFQKKTYIETAEQAIETMRTKTDTSSQINKVKTVAPAKQKRDVSDKFAGGTGQ